MGGCAASTLRRSPEPPCDKDDAAPQGPKVFALAVDATASKLETWHAAAAAHEDRIAALQSPTATDGDDHPQQPSGPSGVQRGNPSLPATAATSSSGKSTGTRARRSLLPGGRAAVCASRTGEAPAQAPAASATGSSAGASSSGPFSSASSSASRPMAPPTGLSAQPTLPVAHPLPQRRVRFDDSPVKTHKHPEEEAEEEAQAAATPHVQPHLAPIRTGAEPEAASSVVQAPRQQAAPQRAGSPSKAIFDAALAARSGLPALAAAAAAVAAASPRKSAAALAVPMSDLIHSVASLSRAGWEPTHRKTNQDSCCAFSQYCRPTQALLAALDGHGPQGHVVSSFLKERLPLALAAALGEGAAAGGGAGGAFAAAAGRPPVTGGVDPVNASFSSTGTAHSRTSGQQQRGSPSKPDGRTPRSSGGGGGGGSADGPSTAAALASTFLRLDADVRRELGANANYSGSTAAVCMLQGRRLTTAWVGDSKAVLARQDPRGLRAIPLTRDHKPNHPDERARILGAGGRVQRLADARGQPVGPNRVWLADSWVPGLAMSRAIGDIVAHTVGVSSEPETSAVELCPQDKWLVVATDGVWEFIDPQAAIDIVGGCKTAEEACRALVDSAWSKWLQEEDGVVDDITVVAVKLNPV